MVLELRKTTSVRGLRIAHITEAPRGGVISYLIEVVSGQASNAEIESIDVLVSDIDMQTVRDAAPSNVRLHSFRRQRRSLAMLVRLWLTTRELLRSSKPDLLHVHSTFAGVVARLCLLTWRCRPIVLYSPHGWAFDQANSRILSSAAKYAERVLASLTDSIVCVSAHEKRTAIEAGLREDKFTVVLSGLAIQNADCHHLPSKSASANQKLKLLYVGRFDYKKGFDIYLEAMGRLGDVATGTAIGDFVISQPSTMTPPPNNVTVLPWLTRSALIEAYRESDIVLIPSRWEAFGYVAIEAMREGLPVFASRVGGLSEIVEDSVTGRLFDVGDTDQLVRIVRMTSFTTLQEYGKRGKERFLRHFTANRMNELLMAHYRHLISSPLQSAVV